MSAIKRSSEVAFQACMEEKGVKGNLKRLRFLECDNPGVGADDISRIKRQLSTITEVRYR